GGGRGGGGWRGWWQCKEPPFSRLAGIRLPANGALAASGFRMAVVTCEKLPPRINIVGKLDATIAGVRWRSASYVPKKKALLRLIGPPVEAPKLLRIFCPFAAAKYGLAFRAEFS